MEFDQLREEPLVKYEATPELLIIQPSVALVQKPIWWELLELRFEAEANTASILPLLYRCTCQWNWLLR